ncbi:MAG: hypothetical protein KDN22_18895 [Verrucomicrobiae bacterium]|nr:hypothetical protein [Verrucomicrobiae bacterium]
MNEREPRSAIGRYKVVEQLENHPLGLTFKIIDPDNHCYAGLKTFFDHPAVMTGGLDVGVVRELAKRRASECFLSYYRIHPVRPQHVGTEERPLLITEWIEGVTLQELLRIRRTLTLPETVTVLTELADAVDAGDHVDPPPLDEVLIAPLNTRGEFLPAATANSMLRAEFGQWPQMLIKFDPIGRRLPQPIDHSGGQTKVAAPWPVWIKPTNESKIAYLAYLMLGGRPGIGSSPRLSQIPELGEAGNDLLHQVIHSRGQERLSAPQFVARLQTV